MLANESTELVQLGTLRDIDSVPVTEVLELRLAPGVDELVSQGGIGSFGAGRGARELVLGAEIGEPRVAAYRRDQLVPSGDLGSGKSVSIQPLLEIRVCCPILAENFLIIFRSVMSNSELTYQSMSHTANRQDTRRRLRRLASAQQCRSWCGLSGEWYRAGGAEGRECHCDHRKP